MSVDIITSGDCLITSFLVIGLNSISLILKSSTLLSKQDSGVILYTLLSHPLEFCALVIII